MLYTAHIIAVIITLQNRDRILENGSKSHSLVYSATYAQHKPFAGGMLANIYEYVYTAP